MSETYIRKMVILREEQSGYRADVSRPCAGRALLEATGAQGKLTLSVQNLKPGHVYTLYLIEAGDTESVGIPLGRFRATDKGKADEKMLFDAGPDSVRIGDRAVVALVACAEPLTAPLAGAVNPTASGTFIWRGNFKEYVFPVPDCSCPKEEPAETGMPAPVPTPIEPTPTPEPAPAPPETLPAPPQTLPERSETMPSPPQVLPEYPEILPEPPEILPEPPEAIPLPAEPPENPEPTPIPGDGLPGSARPSMPWNGFPPDADTICTEVVPETPAPPRFEVLQAIDAHERFAAAVIDFHAADTLFVAYPTETDAPPCPDDNVAMPEPDIAPPSDNPVTPIHNEAPDVDATPDMDTVPDMDAVPENDITSPGENMPPSGDAPLDIWRLFETNEPVTPFEKQNVDVSWVLISMDELMRLPFNMPRLLESDFLRDSYVKNDRLILGKLSQGIMTRFVLGVPGLYDEGEHRAAARLGFRQFKTLDGEPAAPGTPGYWLLII